MNCLSHLRKHRPSPVSEKSKIEADQRELERVRGQWPVVLRYAAALTEHQRRNHFAESLNSIFRGGPA